MFFLTEVSKEINEYKAANIAGYLSERYIPRDLNAPNLPCFITCFGLYLMQSEGESFYWKCQMESRVSRFPSAE